eukprot:86246-Prorocentrum_minimum.AAC.2
MLKLLLSTPDSHSKYVSSATKSTPSGVVTSPPIYKQRHPVVFWVRGNRGQSVSRYSRHLRSPGFRARWLLGLFSRLVVDSHSQTVRPSDRQTVRQSDSQSGLSRLRLSLCQPQPAWS